MAKMAKKDLGHKFGKELVHTAAIAGVFGLIAYLVEPKNFALSIPSTLITAAQSRIVNKLAEGINTLVDKALIKENINEDILAQNMLVDLMRQIDENPNQSERIDAMQSLFFKYISKQTSEIERLMSYQLMQKAKELSSMDTLVLKTCFGVFLSPGDDLHTKSHVNEWRDAIVGKLAGQGDLKILVAQSEQHLITLGLLEDAYDMEKVRYNGGERFRLSELGLSLCKLWLKEGKPI